MQVTTKQKDVLYGVVFLCLIMLLLPWMVNPATFDPTGGGSNAAPINATYITQTANATLNAEQALDSLSSGIMRVETATGVVTSLTTSAGIAANISDETGSGLAVFSIAPTFNNTGTGNSSITITGSNHGRVDLIDTGAADNFQVYQFISDAGNWEVRRANNAVTVLLETPFLITADNVRLAAHIGSTASHNLTFHKSRGDVSTPTVITTGDSGGQISTAFYVGGTNTYVTAVQVEAFSEGVIADTATGVGGVWRVSTMVVGSAIAERFRIASNGAWGLAGATYGAAGNVLTSNGSGSAPTWQAAGGGATLDGITAATADEAGIANADWNVRWNWAKVTDSEVALELGESAAATGGTSTSGIPNQVLLKLSTLAASTMSPFQIYNRGAHVLSIDPTTGSLVVGTADPGYSFANDTDTGMGQASANTVGFWAGGSERVRVASTGVLSAVLGTAAAPSYSFTGATNVGMYTEDGGALNFAVGGVAVMDMGDSFLRFRTAGTVAAPNIATTSTVNTGLFVGTLVGIAVGGVEQARYTSGVYQASKGTADAVAYAMNVRKSRGTVASPTVITTDDNLLTLSGYGYVGAANTYQEAAQILFDSAGTISDSTTGIGGVVDILTAIVGAEPALRMRIDNVGHIVTSGTAPTMGACGTGPSVAGNDMVMEITVGTGGVATSCAVTFAQTWLTNAPVCVAESDTDIVAIKSVETTTTATFSVAAAFTASSKLEVVCFGRV